MKKQHKPKLKGRYWAIKCSNGIPHPGIIIPDTIRAFGETARIMMVLDNADWGEDWNCGPHMVMELREVE